MVTNSIQFCFLLWKQSLICLKGKSMNDPLLEKILLSFNFSSNTLVLVLDPWRAFLATSVALEPCRVCCFWNYRETRAPSVVPGLLRRSQDIIKTYWHKRWLCDYRKAYFLRWSFTVISQQNRIELVTRPYSTSKCPFKTLSIWQGPV